MLGQVSPFGHPRITGCYAPPRGVSPLRRVLHRLLMSRHPPFALMPTIPILTYFVTPHPDELSEDSGHSHAKIFFRKNRRTLTLHNLFFAETERKMGAVRFTGEGSHEGGRASRYKRRIFWDQTSHGWVRPHVLVRCLLSVSAYLACPKFDSERETSDISPASAA